MLVSRGELQFDFKGARFNLADACDRQLLGWIFNQFLYGEVTGIQCGYWLYRAPTLHAATFLARQAGEELSHVRRILRIFSILKEKPASAHWAIRYLSTGLMGNTWGEHVALEMALGEGLVLGVFYAMAETIPDPEIRKILESALIEEERHVEFGERETRAWLEAHPESRPFLLASAWIQVWVLRRLKRFIAERLLLERASHPVLSQFEDFYAHSIRCLELRIERLGLARQPLSEMVFFEKLGLFLGFPFRKLGATLRRRKLLLTSTYLDDPVVKEELRTYRPS